MKFKLLRHWKKNIFLRKYIPNFWELDDLTNIKNLFETQVNKSYILRSQLAGEACFKLAAGRSLSIKNIKTYEDFLFHWQHIQKIQGRCDCILMEEIDYLYHGTLWWQLKEGKIELTCAKTNYLSNIYFSENVTWGQSSELAKEIKLIKKFLKIFQQNIFNSQNQSMLMEFALDKHQIYLFQAVPIPETLLQKKSFFIPLKSNQYQNFNLWKMIWKSWQLRNQKKVTFEDSATNWSSLWLYYLIFLHLHGLNLDSSSWNQYLLWAKKKNNFLAEIALNHIKIHHQIGLADLIESPAQFSKIRPQMWFMGTGKNNFQVKDCLICTELPNSKELIKLPAQSLILTTSRNQLSHSYLTAVEEGIPMVANIPGHNIEEWRKLDPSSYLCVDFNQKTLKQISGV